MSEVLSQNEIDSLLAALSSGELDVDEIKDTKENINILGNIYGGGSLGNILGTTNINIEDHYSDNYSISIMGNIFGGGRGILGSTSPRSSANLAACSASSKAILL